MNVQMDLTGRAVIVTGSSSGIGEAIARRAASLGAGVVVNSRSSSEAGRRVAEQLPDAVYLQGDVGEAGVAEALTGAAMQRWGRLDGVVNNAGVTVPVPLSDFDGLRLEHWDQVLRTNVIGTFMVSQAALAPLRASGDGWIVNVTSVAGVRQTGSSLPYAVSKAALNHMTAIMAKFVGPEIRVNAVAPGLVDTPWTEGWDDLRAQLVAAAPLRRVATVDDVADAWAAVVANRYMTGQVIVVDGGVSVVL